MGKKRDSPDLFIGVDAFECICAKWANFGKQNWRCGMNQTSG